MVRILPSGEVVQDNDPRLQQQQGRQRPAANINTLQHNDDDDEMYQEGEGHGQGQGAAVLQFFNNINERLSEAGVPRWNLGPYNVEPIVSAAFLLAFMLLGFRGVLFGLILFLASKWSSGGGRTVHQPHRSGGSGPRRPGPGGDGGGGGHRLGRR